jgi:hypothetical protein
VSDEQLPPEEADVEEVNSQLNEGLQTCRSVLANYRTLLSGVDARVSSNDNEPDDRESLSGIDER